jgi:hypothetical protein
VTYGVPAFCSQVLSATCRVLVCTWGVGVTQTALLQELQVCDRQPSLTATQLRDCLSCIMLQGRRNSVQSVTSKPGALYPACPCKSCTLLSGGGLCDDAAAQPRGVIALQPLLESQQLA